MKRHVFFQAAAALAAACSLAFVQTAVQRAPADSVGRRCSRGGRRRHRAARVGVGVKGKSVLERAYGMADLEHDVRNVPDTIFEAGSVSKQFTAAAVLLLARDGKLSIDDPVRKYIPELPAYAEGSGGAPAEGSRRRRAGTTASR
jgi:CubicO group peptidase (beta-lactamase class C family)